MRSLGAACVQPTALHNHFTTLSSGWLYSILVYSLVFVFRVFSLECRRTWARYCKRCKELRSRLLVHLPFEFNESAAGAGPDKKASRKRKLEQLALVHTTHRCAICSSRVKILFKRVLVCASVILKCIGYIFLNYLNFNCRAIKV